MLLTSLLQVFTAAAKTSVDTTKKEINELIAGCSRKVATFLQLLKETGARSGEAWRIKWTDIDLEHGIVIFNLPEKGGKPRQFKVSQKLVAMLNSLPKASQRVMGLWAYSEAIVAVGVIIAVILGALWISTERHKKPLMVFARLRFLKNLPRTLLRSNRTHLSLSRNEEMKKFL